MFIRQICVVVVLSKFNHGIEYIHCVGIWILTNGCKVVFGACTGIYSKHFQAVKQMIEEGNTLANKYVCILNQSG